MSQLTITGDQLQEQRPFRDWGVNIVGNAVVDSPPAERERLLDRLQATNVRLVRFLHVAKDDRAVEPSGRRISEYQPTYDEWKAAWPILDEWMDALAARGMYAWLTCHHRQRLTDAEGHALRTPGLYDVLFGPRPGGIERGEISDLFFWFPELEERVADESVEFAKRYAAHPALGLLTIANEKWATRGRVYAMHQRNEPGSSVYNTAWFRLLDAYQLRWGLTDKDMTAAALEQFHASVGYHSYRFLYQILREEAGVSCPINASALFGDTRLSALVESRAGDFDDFHLYPEAVNDPFDPSAAGRTFASTARSLRQSGRVLTCSEWGSVWQNGVNKGQVSGTRLSAPGYVAHEAIGLGMSACCHYAAALSKLGDDKSGVYDACDDPEFVTVLHNAGFAFHALSTAPIPARESHQITDEELWGHKPPGGKFVESVIPGTTEWSKNTSIGGVMLPEIGWSS